MIVTPAEHRALRAISVPCPRQYALYDPDYDGIEPLQPTLRNLYRFTAAACIHCGAEADSATVRRLRDELGEDIAERLLP